MSSYKTDVAPNILVKEYYSLLKPIQEKVQKNLKENQTLTELRDWLLPMLMNGQMRVMANVGDVRMAAEPESKYKSR